MSEQSSRQLILEAALRVRRELRRIERLQENLGDHATGIPSEVAEAVKTIMTWAAALERRDQP